MPVPAMQSLRCSLRLSRRHVAGAGKTLLFRPHAFDGELRSQSRGAVASLKGQENRRGYRSKHTTGFVRKVENGFVGSVFRKNLSQERYLVAELSKQVAHILGHVIVEHEIHSPA